MTLKPEVEHTRHPEYKINPLFVNRWSPRSMSGEELNDQDIMSLFEALDGHHRLLIINHGDLFMQKEIPSTGIDSSVFCMKVTRYGQ